MRVYISYNIEDNSYVKYLTQKLKVNEVDIWIDSEQLIAGDLVSTKIEAGLTHSDGIIICIGKHGLHNWQLIDIEAAFQIHNNNPGFRIIPVLLPGASETTMPTILKSFGVIDFRQSFEDTNELAKLFKAIQGQKLAATHIQHDVASPGKSIKQKNKKAVCVALVYKEKVLIVQRAATQKSGAGLWQLPGGKVDQGESPIQAAKREVEEEAGIIVEESQLITVADLVDTWVINDTDDYITMSVFYCNVDSMKTSIAPEFETSKWIKVSDFFADNFIVFFGATERYLRTIRRFYNLHLPLKEISDRILNNEPLPSQLKCCSEANTQTIYLLLSLLGFLDDKNRISISSIHSRSLIHILSEWALTEKVIFDAQGDRKWEETIEQKGDIESVEKFRAGLFDEHTNLLGMFSHKLSKALATRYVCDLLITAHEKETNKTFLLIRWDLFAKKFQIPSRGLENINADLASPETAQYVMKERFEQKLLDYVSMEYINKFKTSHVSAGTLEDGPMLKNYIISIFDVIPNETANENIIKLINEVNSATIKLFDTTETVSTNQKKVINFYVWADIELLELKRKTLIGKRLQGYEEMVSELGNAIITKNRKPLLLSSSTTIPIIRNASPISNEDQLKIINLD